MNNYLKVILKKFINQFGYDIQKKKNFYTFIDKYDSYQEAFNASKNEIKYVTKEHQENHKLSNLEELEVLDRFHIFAVFCSISFTQANDELNFLEVGGGHNPIFLYILKSTNKKYKFQILEEENFKIEVPKKYQDYLSYIYKLEDINFKKLHSVIFSGSIQFMENYKIILNRLFANKINYIFITETFFTHGTEDIFVLQNNMENVRFPNIFFSFEKLHQLFYENDYKLIYNSQRKVGAYNHNILDKKDFFVKDLIYKIN
jgi:putative methyltransferase (TIGR04325 family)